jgi:ABC-type nitrate/sulfonate/bicarbonate transport system permease component
VLVRGQDVADLDAARLRRSIGYAMQSVGLFPHRTVAENIATVPRLLAGTRPHRGPRGGAAAAAALDPALAAAARGAFGRPGAARRDWPAPSPADPDILLMDEPFGAVDPITRRELRAVLRGIHREMGKTILSSRTTQRRRGAGRAGRGAARRGAGRGGPPALAAGRGRARLRPRVAGRRAAGLRRLALLPAAAARGDAPASPDAPVLEQDATMADALSRIAETGARCWPWRAAVRRTARHPAPRAMIAAVLALLLAAAALALSGQGGMEAARLGTLAAAHAGLAVAGVLPAALLGVALGIAVTRRRGRAFRPAVDALAAAAQAVPPVVAVALAVPAMGFGPGPTVLALLLYALMPVLRATVGAIESVPPDAREAAAAMGLTRFGTLREVELPWHGRSCSMACAWRSCSRSRPPRWGRWRARRRSGRPSSRAAEPEQALVAQGALATAALAFGAEAALLAAAGCAGGSPAACCPCRRTRWIARQPSSARGWSAEPGDDLCPRGLECRAARSLARCAGGRAAPVRGGAAQPGRPWPLREPRGRGGAHPRGARHGDALDGAELAQENGPERPEAKREIFSELDRLAAPAAILASSTSAIPASVFTEGLAGRARCLVAHPVNPPHLVRRGAVRRAWTAAETSNAPAPSTKRSGRYPSRSGARCRASC